VKSKLSNRISLYLYAFVQRPLGKPRLRWVDNVKLSPGEIGCGDRDWIVLAQDTENWGALVNRVINLWVP
jgi:hypothetical protein